MLLKSQRKLLTIRELTFCLPTVVCEKGCLAMRVFSDLVPQKIGFVFGATSDTLRNRAKLSQLFHSFPGMCNQLVSIAGEQDSKNGALLEKKQSIFILYFLLRNLMEIYSNIQNMHECNNALILNYGGIAS